MRKFDYTFLKKISVPADIMNSATEILRKCYKISKSL